MAQIHSGSLLSAYQRAITASFRFGEAISNIAGNLRYRHQYLQPREPVSVFVCNLNGVMVYGFHCIETRLQVDDDVLQLGVS